jgi:hypothetical protein
MRSMEESWIPKTLEPALVAGDTIEELDVVTGQESPDARTRLPEAYVEQRHVDMATEAGGDYLSVEKIVRRHARETKKQAA